MKPLKAFMFPGQGIQKQGMGKELADHFPEAKRLFLKADTIAGRSISETMFHADESILSMCVNAQPAIFVYQVALAETQTDIRPDVVIGHSFGEYAALVVAKCLSFEDALHLVISRAELARKSIDRGQEMAMAAIVGIETSIVERCLMDLTENHRDSVYIANYNGPGQTVISGYREAVKTACKILRTSGAKRTVMLPIEGAFHTPLISDLGLALSTEIENVYFARPEYPICQCASSSITMDPTVIKNNLMRHAASPVDWTQMIATLCDYGVRSFIEIGTDNSLQKIVRRMLPDSTVTSILEFSTFKGIIPDYSIT